MRRRFGLTSKVTAASAAVVLVAVAIIGFGTMLGVRRTLLQEFEAGAVDQASVNAILVERTLRSPAVDETAILAALRPPVRSRPLLNVGGEWYSASLQFQNSDLPQGIVDAVADGQAALQVASTRAGTVLVVGLPLTGASYFEVFPLSPLETSLETVARTLTIVGAMATLVGGALGLWVSRRVMQPVREVTQTAQRLASGAMDARLDPTLDPDLTLLAESFNRMADGLADRIAKETRFAGDVSHELRSPLTTMATAIDVLQRRRDELSEPGKEALDLLSADTARFQATVMDLLEISRHDAGVVETEIVVLPVGEAVRTVVRRIPDAPVPDVRPSAVGASVGVDLRRLERILGNLVQNAQSHGGGTCSIVVSATGDTAQVAVEDRGPGVPTTDRDRIFERFARGDRARMTGGRTGSGLGLALAVENARSLGGTVVLDESYTEGARFVVEFPIEAP